LCPSIKLTGVNSFFSFSFPFHFLPRIDLPIHSYKLTYHSDICRVRGLRQYRAQRKKQDTENQRNRKTQEGLSGSVWRGLVVETPKTPPGPFFSSHLNWGRWLLPELNVPSRARSVLAPWV
jgi:hypothetical protein